MSKQKRIGVLINAFYSAYGSSFLYGAEQICYDVDCKLIMLPLSIMYPQGRYDYQADVILDFISSANIDMLIIATATLSGYEGSEKITEEVLEVLSKASDVPIISVGLPLKNYPDIICEFENAFESIITHTIENHKCSKFLLMNANSTSKESLEREAVLRKVLASKRISLDKNHIISGNFSYQAALDSINRYLDAHGLDFDVLVCLNDNMAAGCMKAFSKRGIRVPEDVALIGFDNDYESDFDRLSLTTVDQRLQEQAYLAIDRVLEIYEGKDVPLHTVLQATPIIRTSCGCPDSSSEYRNKQFGNSDKYNKDNMYLNFYHRHWSQLSLFNSFLMYSQQPLPIEKLSERLEQSFRIFEIPLASIILYDEPVYNLAGRLFSKPDKAHLVFQYNEKTGIFMPQIYFNPNDYMSPPEIENEIEVTRIVLPIFGEAYQYGYMILSLGRNEHIFYQNVYELMAKEIVTSINVSLREKEKEKLLSKNMSLEEHSERLQTLSYTDEMTNVLNRRGFYDLAQKLIEMQTSNGGTGALLYCDMDGLKKINDSYGHKAGDLAIKYESEVLTRVCRNTDIVGRLGGDEFSVVIPNAKAADVARIKKNIIAECKRINQTMNEEFTLSLSVGSAIFTSSDTHLESILSKADVELYKEKRRKQKKNF